MTAPCELTLNSCIADVRVQAQVPATRPGQDARDSGQLEADDEDDLFVAKPAASRQPGEDDADAIDAMDTSLSMSRLKAEELWSAPGAVTVESLRNRFVTGEHCRSLASRACCIASTCACGVRDMCGASAMYNVVCTTCQ